MGYDMLEGKSGIQTINRDGTEYVMIYAPIKRTGWSMATAIPAEVIYRMAIIVGMIIMGCMLLGLIILYFICRTTLKRITSPLARFSRSANEIANGNFNAPLPEITTKDEMKELYDSFKMMQSSLTDRIEELKAANEQKGRIEGELQTARSIQMSMIPKIFPAYPERTDMDIFAKLTPAKEVGGDLYDFFIRNEKLYLCIGDVSGKGVPASLLMAVTRSLFRTVSNHESDPAKIAILVNDAMSEDNVENMFVTLFIAILDLPTGQMRYCNAGHCAPVIIDTEANLLPIIPNIPVGLLPHFKYVGQEVIVKPDTTVFMYTDGVTEAEDINHHLFDEDRMMEVARTCLQENHVQPDVLVNEMEESIRKFVKDAEQSDDQTMMAIRYTKKEEAARLQRHLTLPNNIDTIPELSEFIEGVGEELGMDMSLVMSLNLAIEEAVVNVMEYAYPPGVEGTVEIDAIANDNRLKIIISDGGIPFDPTKKEKVDTTLSAEERPIGGLGIHLVREIMDSVNYEYRDRKNILTLRKNLKN
jgi:sigma-B regulation protein RsbU (phosphoserine phosphatase)